jgi:glycosyltransferase involved in cell wall biosynthesis
MSLNEGFGLPIAESLWQGIPCLCSDHGPMAEIAEGGGCLMVPAMDTRAIEHALERLADDADLRRRLRLEARSRRLRSWREYADDVVCALEDAPLLRELVVVEGSRGIGPDADTLVAGVVRRLHWKTESRALLPGASYEPELPAPGAGQLHHLPAVVKGATAGGPDELIEIVEAARSLGLRVALEAEPEFSPTISSSADVALFRTSDDRDAVLAKALRELPRTVGVRARFELGRGEAAAAAVRASRGRLSTAGPGRRPRRVYYWVGLTISQPFNTGVQRVTRRLAAALQVLGVEVVPVKWDGLAERLAPLSENEADHLAHWSGPRTLPRPLPDELTGEWLLVPEITVPVVPVGSNVARLGHALGMRVAAVFYDLIPAKMPENYPASTLEALIDYWRSFAEVDLALPISWSVTSDLTRWLAGEGLRVPRVVPCVLAGDSDEVPRATTPAPCVIEQQPLKLLAVGTLEPRKNYPRLLHALSRAQQRAGRRIELTIVGRRAGFEELDVEIERLVAEAGGVLLGHVGDDELRNLHQEASATVFASWEEGFGLPVLESLWQGRPCLCHAGSAMAELIPGGGVLPIDMLDERKIEDALVSLADDAELLERLGREAIERPIRTWDEYAEDVVRALTSATSPSGWSLPAVVQRRPLLTCAITTYNRAPWLQHSLPRLLEVTRPWRDIVEVVVCDNASTDETPDIAARFRGEENFASFRNQQNLGMLGNLGATARASRGAFVWLLGDDDLLIDGAVENVLEGIARHPDVEMAYMNYAYTQFNDPVELGDVRQLVANATPIAEGGSNRYVAELREVAGLNENLFTAIYTCAFRRDHALRAYQLDTRGVPFTSLATCVPSSVYALAALQDRPAWWVGEPAVVVNMNVSWLRWALLWHLERMPDLFEEAEARGVDSERLDVYRLKHLLDVDQWVRRTYFEAEDVIRSSFSLARLLERSKHLPEFRRRHLKGVRRAYTEAWEAGRVVVDQLPPDELFKRYGL